eukprot:5719972-Alexandrium_andersonii.AAC.1
MCLSKLRVSGGAYLRKVLTTFRTLWPLRPVEPLRWAPPGHPTTPARQVLSIQCRLSWAKPTP